MTIRIAVTENKAGNLDLIHCRLWENWHGATDLERTKEQLLIDHPDAKFIQWVVEDINDLACCFLSPNVRFVERYVQTPGAVELKRIYRNELS